MYKVDKIEQNYFRVARYIYLDRNDNIFNYHFLTTCLHSNLFIHSIWVTCNTTTDIVCEINTTLWCFKN